MHNWSWFWRCTTGDKGLTFSKWNSHSDPGSRSGASPYSYRGPVGNVLSAVLAVAVNATMIGILVMHAQPHGTRLESRVTRPKVLRFLFAPEKPSAPHPSSRSTEPLVQILLPKDSESRLGRGVADRHAVETGKIGPGVDQADSPPAQRGPLELFSMARTAGARSAILVPTIPIPSGLRSSDGKAIEENLVSDVNWRMQPSHKDLEGFYPQRALEDHISGWGLIQCRMRGDELVFDCREVAEAPAGSGFAKATVRASWQFRVWPPMIAGSAVRIRLDWSQP